MSFSAEELTEFVTTVAVKVAQPQLCYSNLSKGAMEKKSNVCKELKPICLNNDEYTHLDAGHGTTDILDMAFVAPSLKPAIFVSELVSHTPPPPRNLPR